MTITDVYEDQNKGISFYPNPAADNIRIQTTALLPSPVDYFITNAIGIEVEKGTLKPEGLLQGRTIDVHQLPAGIYFLTWRSSERKFTTRFVKE